MELLLLLALGALANIWLGSGGDDALDDDDESSRRPDPDEDQRLRGTEDKDDLLQSGSGDDTISGNGGDADTLIGNAGDDRLVMQGGNIATGGPGADVFVANGGPGTITDFEPGTDQLRFTYVNPGPDEDSIFEPVYDWRIDGDGANLQLVDAYGDRHDIATLQGLDAPPPAGDLVQTEYSERAGMNIDRVDGEDLLFLQRVEGTDADDTVSEIARPSAIIEGDLGAGDDTATILAQRAVFDLGPGDDSYTSLTEDRGLGQDNYTATGSFETVRGGDGDDIIVAGGGEMLARGGAGDDVLDFSLNNFGEAHGGPGDDTINGALEDMFGIAGSSLTLNGGPGNDVIVAENVNSDGLGPGYGTGFGEIVNGDGGDDTLYFGEFDTVTGGAGADAFFRTLTMPLETGDFATPTIRDFDPDEDMLMIALPEGYEGAGAVSIAAWAAGGGTDVLIDGSVVARLGAVLSDTSGIGLVS